MCCGTPASEESLVVVGDRVRSLFSIIVMPCQCHISSIWELNSTQLNWPRDLDGKTWPKKGKKSNSLSISLISNIVIHTPFKAGLDTVIADYFPLPGHGISFLTVTCKLLIISFTHLYYLHNYRCFTQLNVIHVSKGIQTYKQTSP